MAKGPPEATTIPQLDSPIAVVGAGIAGLTVALALREHGFEVEIFERAPQLEEAGAGIQLSPNALRVLDRLGLGRALGAKGVSARSVTLKSLRSGRNIAEVPVTAGDGTAYLSIHRADLQAVLLDAVRRASSITLKTGTGLESLQRHHEGSRLQLRSAGGTYAAGPYPLVVAADGIRSAVAAGFALPPSRPSGWIAWRGTISGRAAPPLSSIAAWLGPDRHAVAYPVEAGAATNLVLIERTPPAGAAAQGSPDHRFGLTPMLGTYVAAAGEQMTPWPLATVPAARPWCFPDDRVVLIGDAAHAMLPYAAQGAAMAIEDAAVLASALAAASDVPVALRRYENERRPRVNRVRRRAEFHQFVYHLARPFSLGRDAVLALRPSKSLRNDLGWLYDWQPPPARL